MGSLLNFTQLKELKGLNTKRFFVENVRVILGSSTREARHICEVGVKEGLFTKKTGVVCKSCERIIKSYNDKEIDPSQTITCDLCEMNGEEDYDWILSDLIQKDIYGMVR